MRKDKIIEEVTPLFMRLGYRNLSMDQIAKELKISKKTLYEQFENKLELIQYVLGYRDLIVRERAKRIFGTAENAIDAYLQTRVNLLEIVPITQQRQNIFQIKKYYKKIYSQSIKDLENIIQTLMIEMLDRGISEGYFISDYDTHLMAEIYTANYMEMLTSDKFMTEEEYKNYSSAKSHIFLHGILTEKGREYIAALKSKDPSQLTV
ncbi:MAG: TetR/AcrR family transcriptional regulator [Weeksellaceae bacterium]|nr:TetR/AcrR family transcriptional regulator [Weeksellaceae bacterium]